MKNLMDVFKTAKRFEIGDAINEKLTKSAGEYGILDDPSVLEARESASEVSRLGRFFTNLIAKGAELIEEFKPLTQEEIKNASRVISDFKEPARQNYVPNDRNMNQDELLHAKMTGNVIPLSDPSKGNYEVYTIDGVGTLKVDAISQDAIGILENDGVKSSLNALENKYQGMQFNNAEDVIRYSRETTMMSEQLLQNAQHEKIYAQYNELHAQAVDLAEQYKDQMQVTTISGTRFKVDLLYNNEMDQNPNAPHLIMVASDLVNKTTDCIACRDEQDVIDRLNSCMGSDHSLSQIEEQYHTFLQEAKEGKRENKAYINATLEDLENDKTESFPQAMCAHYKVVNALLKEQLLSHSQEVMLGSEMKEVKVPDDERKARMVAVLLSHKTGEMLKNDAPEMFNMLLSKIDKMAESYEAQDLRIADIGIHQVRTQQDSKFEAIGAGEQYLACIQLNNGDMIRATYNPTSDRANVNALEPGSYAYLNNTGLSIDKMMENYELGEDSMKVLASVRGGLADVVLPEYVENAVQKSEDYNRIASQNEKYVEYMFDKTQDAIEHDN